MSAITALTAQNTLGVTGIMEVTPEFLNKQIDAVFSDIYPDAVKIGMVSSAKLIEAIAERLRFYHAKNIVVDPVMVATSGAKLINDDAIETLARELLPLASLATPNIPEAEILSGMKINDEAGMIEAAKKINAKFGCAVLVKGGHRVNDANDLLCFNPDNSEAQHINFTASADCGHNENEKLTKNSAVCEWFKGKRIDTNNTHGTGCTLSSAIAANLAKGFTLDEAVRRAKDYISGALGAMLDLGKGCGPMKHSFNLTGKFAENMSLRERLMRSVADIWPEYNNHPFVKGMETGTLEPEKFRFYIIQDYLYLNEYSKVFALGAAKAKSLETMKLFSSVIDAIANVEMDIHKGYMGRLKVSQEEIDRTQRHPANLAYTSYMLRVAYEEEEPEILAAILSCALSYEDIAKKIVENNPQSVNHELYGKWIRNYSGEEYCGLNNVLVAYLEKSAENYSDLQLEHLCEIFRACSIHEMNFWDMANA